MASERHYINNTYLHTLFGQIKNEFRLVSGNVVKRAASLLRYMFGRLTQRAVTQRTKPDTRHQIRNVYKQPCECIHSRKPERIACEQIGYSRLAIQERKASERTRLQDQNENKADYLLKA